MHLLRTVTAANLHSAVWARRNFDMLPSETLTLRPHDIAVCVKTLRIRGDPNDISFSRLAQLYSTQ